MVQIGVTAAERLRFVISMAVGLSTYFLDGAWHSRMSATAQTGYNTE